MKYCLLDIAYDDSFHGFQLQPDVKTVQGAILKALEPIGIKKVTVSSRTDAHVRASSNIVEMATDDCLKVCKIVDSIKGIIVKGYYVSEEYVKLRGRVRKYYLYFHSNTLNEILVSRTISEFMSSDYSFFSREPERKVFLEKISFRNYTDFSTFIFVGRSFSWNFVRISAENIIRRIEGEIDDIEWSDLLHGRQKYRFKGSPGNLILIHTDTGLEMTRYYSKKLKYLKDKEIKELFWLHGIGIDFESVTHKI